MTRPHPRMQKRRRVSNAPLVWPRAWLHSMARRSSSAIRSDWTLIPAMRTSIQKWQNNTTLSIAETRQCYDDCCSRLHVSSQEPLVASRTRLHGIMVFHTSNQERHDEATIRKWLDFAATVHGIGAVFFQSNKWVNLEINHKGSYVNNTLNSWYVAARYQLTSRFINIGMWHVDWRYCVLNNSQ